MHSCDYVSTELWGWTSIGLKLGPVALTQASEEGATALFIMYFYRGTMKVFCE